jgi:hypothetical protein
VEGKRDFVWNLAKTFGFESMEPGVEDNFSDEFVNSEDTRVLVFCVCRKEARCLMDFLNQNECAQGCISKEDVCSLLNGKNVKLGKNRVVVTCEGCKGTQPPSATCTNCESPLDLPAYLNEIQLQIAKNEKMASVIVSVIPEYLLGEIDLKELTYVGEGNAMIPLKGERFLEIDVNEKVGRIVSVKEVELVQPLKEGMAENACFFLESAISARKSEVVAEAQVSEEQASELLKILRGMNPEAFARALLSCPVVVEADDSKRKALFDEVSNMVPGLPAQAQLGMIWKMTEDRHVKDESPGVLDKQKAKEVFQDVLSDICNIEKRFGVEACVWAILYCGVFWLEDCEFQVDNWALKKGAIQSSVRAFAIKVRNVARLLGLWDLISINNLRRMNLFLRLFRSLCLQGDELSSACKIDIPGGNYWIVVRGWTENNDFCVDLYHANRAAKSTEISLSTDILRKHIALDDWAKNVLGIPCASKFDQKTGDDLVLNATEIATEFGGKMTANGRICVYGRQEKDMFVLSKEYILDLSGKQIKVDRLLLFDPVLLSLSFGPTELSSGRGSVKDWIDEWKRRYHGVHLAELVFGIAHIAMCMKRVNKKPPLVYCGSSGCGKTSIMEFSARMLGFDGTVAMLADVTNVALWERLHFLSGLPTFCNDPKGEKLIKVLKDDIIPVFDGTSRATAKGTRNANGFLVISVNDKEDNQDRSDGPLEKLLETESGANRLILCPVSPIPKDSFVDDDAEDCKLSSVPLIGELLSIKETTGLTDSSIGGRLGASLATVFYYFDEVMRLANLTEDEKSALNQFKARSRDFALEKQLRHKVEQELLREFEQMVFKKFFKSDGCLIDLSERICTVGSTTCPIIQVSRSGDGIFDVRFDEMFEALQSMEGKSDCWVKTISSESDLKHVVQKAFAREGTATAIEKVGAGRKIVKMDQLRLDVKRMVK